MNKIYYLYRITNLINQKYYLGKRSAKCKCPTDDVKYMGSGKLINYAIKKYGKENFKKDILQVYPTIEELNIAERNLITEVEIADENCYNISLGGHGGNLGSKALAKLRDTMQTDEYKQHMSAALNDPDVKSKISASLRITMSNPAWKEKFSKIQKLAQNRPEEKARNSRNQKLAQNRPEVSQAKSEKMTEAFKNEDTRSRHKASVNTQHFKDAQTLRGKDTTWINNTCQQKYVKVDKLQDHLDSGWLLGMLKRKK